MSKTTSRQLELGATTDESADKCDDCAEPPGEFPCADCYISGRKEFPN